MIFLTVGTQLPFDRLVKAVDRWAYKKRKKIFAQIGKSGYKPKNMVFVRALDPAEFEEKVKRSEIMISHAGMGSIITALEKNKPIIIMPRKSKFKEHRNDHQVYTAREFEKLPNIFYAKDENHLIETLDNIKPKNLKYSSKNSDMLIDTIKEFIIKNS